MVSTSGSAAASRACACVSSQPVRMNDSISAMHIVTMHVPAVSIPITVRIIFNVPFFCLNEVSGLRISPLVYHLKTVTPNVGPSLALCYANE